MRDWSGGLIVGQQKDTDFGASAMAGVVEDLSIAQPPTTLLDAWEDSPTGTPETFLAYIQRDVNCLAEETMSVRLQSLQKLERILVRQGDTLATDVLDAVFDAMLKPLLKRFKDKSEKCRELAVKILRSLVENTSDLAAALPYIFPTLVSRLGCEDLDGVAHLPEIMRPDPEQKPTEIARPVEDSEEVRLELGHFVASLLQRCSPIQIYSYIDEATGLIRAQAMDPFHGVKALACETMVTFCYNNTEMLLHFALPLARSLTSCLTHNHAKLRIAGLRAITACLWCGVWKHNFEIFEVLMAWQDPNKVPIKAFYEGVTNVNYMSTLSFDRHPAVRRFWFETLAYWMLRCVDKVDLEPYIAPYLLTGLCDENEEIALEVFWLIERIGEAYEEEHEEDLRKTKQYGFDYSWTYSGRAFVPFPLQGIWGGGSSVPRHIRRAGAQGPDFLGQRPLPAHQHRDANPGACSSEIAEDGAVPDARSLGAPTELPSRHPVSSKGGRHLLAGRLSAFDAKGLSAACSVSSPAAAAAGLAVLGDCTSLNAGRLLCMSLAYTEEGVTEWLQPMMATLVKFYSGRAWAAGDPRAMQTYSTVCKLLGAFLEPASLWTQLRGALDADSTLDLDQRIASVRILAMALEGHVEVLQSIQPPDPSLRLGQLEPVLPELIDAIHSSDLLLSPTPESREAMWMVLFAFLEPLRVFLTESQVSQLLFISLALASKAPVEELPEPSKTKRAAAPTSQVESEEVLDSQQLERALAALSTGLVEVTSSLDSLDDDLDLATDMPPLQRLFEKALSHVLDRAEDSFQVFRSVLHLSPGEVLLKVAHREQILSLLAGFAGTASAPETRAAAQALGVRLALRIAEAGGSGFAGQVLQLLGTALIQASQGPTYRALSVPVALAGCAAWRRFFLRQGAHLAFAPQAGDEGSSILQWMLSTFADQELYKRLHLAMEHAEKVLTGSSQEDWVLEKARQIRLESERQAAVLRGAAASTALVALRQGLRTLKRAPWSAEGGRSLFLAVASTLGVAPHTLEPPFVRPTPPALLLYTAELLHLLLHLPADAEDMEASVEM
ncbi:Dnaaf5, partial [Symbiodinium pilosum]